MALVVADELVAPRADGRTFTQSLVPLLGDCAPSGRIRLDAIARWLQDIAYADMLDAGVADRAIWVLRRARVQISRFPRFGEAHRVMTYCSGFGRMWAERRTTITAVDAAGQRAGGGVLRPVAEAVALWIHLDPRRRLPAPLTPEEKAIFGSAAGDRSVERRLRHPRPGASASVRGRWWFRESDCDLAAHVNNAAYWEPLEEELLSAERASGEPLAEIDAEIEYRSPAHPGEYTILGDGRTARWLVGLQARDEVHASIHVAAA